MIIATNCQLDSTHKTMLIAFSESYPYTLTGFDLSRHFALTGMSAGVDDTTQLHMYAARACHVN
jgi:hypothetical protein